MVAGGEVILPHIIVKMAILLIDVAGQERDERIFRRL